MPAAAQSRVRSSTLTTTPTKNHARDYEPAFVVPAVSGLTELEDTLGRNATYLSQRIARQPADLKSHVQRFHLHLRHENAAGVWGALIDLFLALEDKGKPLKLRLCRLANKTLRETQQRFLERHIDSGLSTAKVCPAALHSVLSRGLLNAVPLIARTETGTEARRDPVDEAREYLVYGQIDEARHLLEKAILETPERADVHHELLSIYRATRDKQAFVAMYGSLPGGENPASEAWIELARFLTEGA